jgi:hypothetical protein
MNDQIRMFVGFDDKESIAHHVFAHSVQRRASQPVLIAPLYLPQLAGYKERHTDGSNEFVYSRFLVPWLCGFKGWAIFADGDMLMRDDIAGLWELRDRSKAVQVVQHDYKTKFPTKYLGASNSDYPRKNWSSLILWNCEHPANAALTPGVVQSRDGSYLHRFEWLQNQEIGSLSKTWNWLVGEYEHNPFAELAHFTIGAPCFKEFRRCDYADEWFDELRDMLHVQGERGFAWMR